MWARNWHPPTACDDPALLDRKRQLDHARTVHWRLRKRKHERCFSLRVSSKMEFSLAQPPIQSHSAGRGLTWRQQQPSAADRLNPTRAHPLGIRPAKAGPNHGQKRANAHQKRQGQRRRVSQPALNPLAAVFPGLHQRARKML